MEKTEKIQLRLNQLDDVFVAGSMPQEKILEAERLLNITLPLSYKKYLSIFGNISFGPFEVYGLTNSVDPKNTGIPNIVGYNLKKWNTENFPPNLLIIQNNNEQYICLKLDKKIGDNECGLVIWDNINKCEDLPISGTFLDYLLDAIDEYIDEFV